LSFLSALYIPLKLSIILKSRNVDGYRWLLRRSCRCGEYFLDYVVDAPDYEVLQEPPGSSTRPATARSTYARSSDVTRY
jgi:glutamate/tyrosine decarboxylase-like PLP-dependent enzyme